MQKTIKIGMYKDKYMKKSVGVYVEISLKKIEKIKKEFVSLKEVEGAMIFSACGSYHSGNNWLQTGQCLDSIKKDLLSGDLKLDEKIDRKDVLDLVEIWKKYHLNDLMAGTKKQMEITKGKKYDEACKELIKQNLINDMGYKYGSGWLLEQIPSNVIKRIESLFS